MTKPLPIHNIKQTRKGHVTVISRTLPELIEYFSYTLEVGASYDKKVNRKPATIRSFVVNLVRAFEAQEACCYERTHIELA